MTGNDATDLKHWRREMDAAGIVWWCIDKADASANVLSGEVLRELARMLEPVEQDPPRGLVVYSG